MCSLGIGVTASAEEDIDYHADWGRNTLQPLSSILRLSYVPLLCVPMAICAIAVMVLFFKLKYSCFTVLC